MKARAVVLLCGDSRSEEIRKQLPSGFLSEIRRDLSLRIAQSRDLELVVASDGDSSFILRAGEATARIPAHDFTTKVMEVFRFCIDRGAKSVVVIAGDVAGIELSLINDAFVTLEQGDRRAVLGPSSDGGLYLLGLSGEAARASIDWTAAEWFSTNTQASIAALLARAGCVMATLPSRDDVDNRVDAVRVTYALQAHFRSLCSRLLARLAEVRWFALEPVRIDDSRKRAGVRRLRPPPQ